MHHDPFGRKEISGGRGIRVTESWEFLPDGITRFRNRFGSDAAAQIADRTLAARNGIPVTLAAIKRSAESA